AKAPFFLEIVMKYEVKREHFGDQFYKTGDTREADPATVKHLVDKGVLAEPQEEMKPVKSTKQVKSE
ncbi:hypothetical protein, partial [Escherichia marmotae]|uniref:hypothetical protein n=2 Tax=Gammaproteobacteria TaxID=1236 RepID=UPI00215A4651